MFRHLRKLDWILIISALLLVGIGLLSLYSSSLGKGEFLNFQKQFLFAGVGIFLMFLFSFLDYRIFKNDTRLIFILYSLSLLGLTGLFFFAPETRGVRGWYKVGPFSLDPIEFTKIVLILLLAQYFSVRHQELYRIRHIILSGFYVFLPAFLIYLQPDLGSVLIIFTLWLSILVISRIKIRFFLIMFLCGFLILASGWSFFLQDYQKERIISFVAPGLDPLGTSWSQTQSKIAIGSGGLLGQGLGEGSQTQYGFLPEPQTDFIFSAIGEEFGLVGMVILFFLVIVLLSRIFKIALLAQSNFSRLFAVGFATLLAIQIFINIGMNLGLLPVIGISFPLVSYGGSSLIATFVALGILQNIKAN